MICTLLMSAWYYFDSRKFWMVRKCLNQNSHTVVTSLIFLFDKYKRYNRFLQKSWFLSTNCKIIHHVFWLLWEWYNIPHTYNWPKIEMFWRKLWDFPNSYTYASDKVINPTPKCIAPIKILNTSKSCAYMPTIFYIKVMLYLSFSASNLFGFLYMSFIFVLLYGHTSILLPYQKACVKNCYYHQASQKSVLPTYFW